MAAGTSSRVPGYFSAEQLQTESAEKRSNRIEEAYKEQRRKLAQRKKKFAAAKKKNKARKKKSAAAKKQPHASSIRELKGVLAKNAYYAQNGHDYLEKDGARNKVFKDFDMDFAHENTGIPKEVLEAYKFPSSEHVENFNKGAKDIANPKKKAGQQYPYRWEAHHLLPGSAFYYEDAQGHCFEPWQIRLILQSEYNINHGHNIIPLPDVTWAVPIHQLPQHPSDHPIYTQVVMQDLRKISRQLDEARDTGMRHPDLKATIFKDLQRLENKYWQTLVELGKKVSRGIAVGRRLKKPWVTYGTDEDPLKYEWGALY